MPREQGDTSEVRTSDCSQQNMNKEQSTILIDYMKNHTKFAANASLGGNPSFTRQEMFNKLRKLKNAAGPAKTDVQIWASWKYLQRQAKKYNAKKRAAMVDTGNKTKFKKNDKYEDVLEVVGSSHQNGLPLMPELGFKKLHLEDAQSQDVSVDPSANNLKTDFIARPSTSNLKVKLNPSVKTMKKVGTRPASQSSLEDLNVICTTPNKLLKVEFLPFNVDKADLSSLPSSSLKNQSASHMVPTPKILIKSEPSKFTQKYKEYSTMSRRRESVAEMRSQIALNGVNEGNGILRTLVNAFGNLEDSQSKRNKLLEEQNKFLKALVSKNKDKEN